MLACITPIRKFKLLIHEQFSESIQGLPSLNIGTSHSYRGLKIKQLLPLLLFLYRP